MQELTLYAYDIASQVSQLYHFSCWASCTPPPLFNGNKHVYRSDLAVYSRVDARKNEVGCCWGGEVGLFWEKLK